MNTTINVLGMTINSGYSGSISPSSAISITIGASGFSQAGGTFSGGSTTIALNGNYALSGGTFTSTSGTMTILSNVGTFTYSGGTFNHNSGTVYLQDGSNSAGSFSIDVATTITFHNLIFYPKDGGRTLTIASGDTLVTTGTFTQMNGLIETGTIEPRGNVVLNGGNTEVLGTGTVSFLTSGDQTITGNGGSTSHLVINKSSGTVNAGSTNLYVRSFTLSSGTFVSTSGTMIVCTNFTHTAGGTFTHNNGTVQFGSFGTNCGTGGTVDVATSETFYNLTAATKDAGRTITISSGDTLIVTNTFTITAGVFDTGTINAQGNVVIGASSGGGTAMLTFSGTANQTYTDGGTDMTGAVTINKTSGTVSLAQNTSWNSSGQDLAITSGTLSLAGYNLTVNDQLTIGASGTLQLRGSETITGGPDTVTSGATITFTGDGDTAADTYTITSYLSASFKNLTINSTDGETDTFQLGAALTVAGNLTLTAGTFDASASNYQINVSGIWEKEAATFTPRSGTVVLNGTNQTMSGSTTFYNLTKSVSSADTLMFYAGTTQTITNTLTLNGATGNRLLLRSSSTGARWNIDPQSTRMLAYLDVRDSENLDATIIDPGTDSVSGGNNVAWLFDSTAPVLQSFTTNATDGFYGPGDVIEIVATYDETLVTGAELTIELNNGVEVTLDVLSGATASGTYTVGATGSGEDAEPLTVSTIVSESVSDAFANTRTNSTVPSGASNLGGSAEIMIDTTAPDPTEAPQLFPASDTGSSDSDRITADTTPAFSVNMCEGEVTLSGASLTATETCNGGAVDIQMSTVADGTHDFKARHVDEQGNVSGWSAAVSVTIDTTDPVLAEVTPVATPATDTTPTYVFSSTEAGTITYGGSCASSTTAATSGSNSISFSALAVGSYADCTVTVTDDAGNASTALAVTAFTIEAAVSSSSSSSEESSSINNGGGGGGRGTAGPGGRSDKAQIVRETFLRRFERQVASDEAVIPPISGSSASSRSSRSSRPTVVEAPATGTGIIVAEKRGYLEVSTGGIAVLYKDVPVEAWYAPYISFLIEENIAQGYKDEEGKSKGEFGVENAVTYAELAKMVLQASHKDLKTAAAPRNMTARGTWASSFIALAEDLYFSVYIPTLDIMKPATRGEVIQTILEAFRIPIGNQKAPFTDVSADHANNAAIAVAVFYGFVDGDTDANGVPIGTFRPNDSVNRAEVAKIIALALKLLK